MDNLALTKKAMETKKYGRSIIAIRDLNNSAKGLENNEQFSIVPSPILLHSISPGIDRTDLILAESPITAMTIARWINILLLFSLTAKIPKTIIRKPMKAGIKTVTES